MCDTVRNSALKSVSGSTECLLNCFSTAENARKLRDEIRAYLGRRPVLYTEHLRPPPGKRQRRNLEDIAKELVAHPEFQRLNPALKMTLVEAFDATELQSVEQARLVARALLQQVERARIPHGDAVGVVAAQSCSEKFTQSALNTFHSAGAKRSALVGIKRIEELLDASKSLSLPVLTGVGPRARDLIGRTLDELSERSGIVYIAAKNKSPYAIFFDLREMPTTPLPQSVAAHYEMHGRRLLLQLPAKQVRDIGDAKRIYFREKNRHAAGLPGCIEYDAEEDALYFKEKTCLAQSVDLGAVAELCDEQSMRKLRGNDPLFIAEFLGIAAAEQFVMQEMMHVLGQEGIHISPRHLSLIAGNMTQSGSVVANRFAGLRIQDSVILKASFEQASKTFANAAAAGLQDTLDDLSAQILVGAPARIGTEKACVIAWPVQPPVETCALRIPEPEIEYVCASPASPPRFEEDQEQEQEILEPELDL